MSFRPDPEQKQSDAKQKVTLYLSPELYRKLKIQAAVEVEPMSVMAERALQFYLEHSDVVETLYGSTHQVHHCPACSHPFVLQHGQVKSLCLVDGSEAGFDQAWDPGSPKQDELVPC